MRLGVVPDPGEAIRERRVARISGIFIVTLAVGMAVGAGYENVEWIEDKFGILGGHFVKGLWDTETDLLCDDGRLAGRRYLPHRLGAARVVEPPGDGRARAGAEREPARGGREAVPDRPRLRRARRAGSPSCRSPPQGSRSSPRGVLLLALPSPSLRTVGIVLGIALLAYAVFEAFEIVRRADRGASAALESPR